MSQPLDSLQPALLWKHFDAIRRIPRPSKHEERIARHVQSWAEERGLEVRRDAAGNLCIPVPASEGHEDAPVVILQGHLDMVCEKNADTDHDFMTEGIEVAVDDDWVHAKGTTLGADNGVGLAAALAVAEDTEAVHGPLEILCTVDEETGLTGAKELDPAIVSGRVMINLDTEEDGAVYIGCAGGADTTAELKTPRRGALMNTVPARVAVTGLRGGHSGLNILENRGNAVKLAVRVLLAAVAEGIELDLVSFQGGSKHNAIPREAFATVRVPNGDVPRLAAVAESQGRDFAEEFGATDPDLRVTVEEMDDDDSLREPVNVHARDRLLRLVDAMPHGVLAMSREVPGLVETSTNMAVIQTDADSARLIASHRSSIMPALYAVRQQVGSLCRRLPSSAAPSRCSSACSTALPRSRPSTPAWSAGC